jgi:hypothetical protein
MRRNTAPARRFTPLAAAACLALASASVGAAPRTWIGGAAGGSFWDLASNWQGGSAPGAADDALLGAFDTEIRTGFSINSLSGTGRLTFGGGASLTLASASSIGALRFDAGTLAGAGALTVTGASSWTAGAMTGPGTTTFNAGVTLGGASTVRDVTAGRTVVFNGSTTWTNTFNSGGRFRMGSGATLRNNAAWTDNAAFDTQITNDFGGAASTFQNLGSYTKGGAGTTAISVVFDNTRGVAPGTGVVTVNAGGLLLIGGGTANSGSSFTSAAGTTLGFGGGYTLAAGSSVNAAGLVRFVGGINSVAGDFQTSAGVRFESGTTTTFTGNLSGLGSSVVATGGNANFNNAQALNVSSLEFTSSGGTLNFNNTGGITTGQLTMAAGTLGGSSGVVVNGNTSSWTSGTMTGTGTTTFNGDLTLGGGSSVRDVTGGRTVVFNGSTTWTNAFAGGGRFRTGDGATLRNNGAWTDSAAFETTMGNDFAGAASTFQNLGSYTKAGAGTTTISLTFDNTRSTPGTGVVAVNSGGLLLTGGGTANSGSSFTSAAGTVLGFGGNYTLQAGSSVNAAGLVRFFTGSNSMAGDFQTSAGVRFESGTTTFTGTVSGVGSSVVAAGGTANFNNTQAFSVSSVEFTSSGGTLNFNNTGGITTGQLTLTTGTLGGSSSVVVNGNTSSWVGGTMTGAGTTTFNGDIALGGPSSVRDVTGGRTVVFNGNTTWTNTFNGGGRFRTGSGATLRNNGAWTDNTAFDTTIGNDFGGAASTFQNRGSYTKAGAGTTAISLAFDNTRSTPGTGAVAVNSGALLLVGGGTANIGSTFTSAAGTTLALGGNYILEAGSSVNAQGLVRFTSGTNTVAGSVQTSGVLEAASGSTTFNGASAASAGTLALSGGTFNFINSGGITSARLDLASGTLAGTSAVTVTGNDSSWTGGIMTGTGTTTFAGDVALVGATSVRDITNGRTVLFNGTTTWTNTFNSGGRLRTGGGVTLRNNGSWQDNTAFDTQMSNDFGNAASTFRNAGTYTKAGAGTTTIGLNFENLAGASFVVNGGTVVLQGTSSSNAGTIALGAGRTLHVAGGTLNLGGTLTGAATSRLLLTFGSIGNEVDRSFAGVLDLRGGTATMTQAMTVGGLEMSGGTLEGAQNLTATGASSWTGGQMRGSGTTTFSGALALGGTTSVLDVTSGGRTVVFAGTTTWTNTFNSGARIRTGAGATLRNAGTWWDNTAFATQVSNDFGGANSSFVNAGTYRKTGGATTTFFVPFTNDGAIEANAGTLAMNGGFTNFAANTLTGGSITVNAGATLRFTGANIVTNASRITLDGTGSALLNDTNGTNALANFASNTAAGEFTIRNGRNLTTAGAFSNAGRVTVGTGSTFSASGSGFSNTTTGSLQMAGGTLAAPAGTLSNAGTVSGFGTVSTLISNSGSVTASGGTLNANGGIAGNSGSVTVLSGAVLNLASAAGASSSATLALQGSLDLGAQNYNVASDYDNASFGEGNAFDPRANVSGAGQIIGTGAVLALAGNATANGANAWILDFGTVRGGTNGTRSFAVANTGNGASIRSALQNAANGASITDARLSGSGLVAGNLAPIGGGAESASFSVTLNAGAAGGSLSGQALAVAGNFANTPVQTLTLQGFTTVIAQGQAAPAGPVNLGNFRVGVSPFVGGALDVSNLTTGPGAERLGIGSVTASGNFSATSALAGAYVAPGATQSGAVTFASTGVGPGANSGSVTIEFVSNGALFDASFGDITSNNQTVILSSTGYRIANPTAAAPSPVVLANQRVGGTLTQALSITNNLPADGYSEGLNASIGASGSATAGGSFSLLAAGATSNALFVGVDTATAGAKSGVATITFATDGTGTSGFAATALPGNQTVNVSGDVYRLAVAGPASPSPVVLANQRVGGSLTQALSVTNTAAADGFSEGLNASIGASGSATAGGSFSLLAAGATSNALFVGVDTATAGAKSGVATINFATDGTGTSGFAATALPGNQTVNVSGNVYRLAVAGPASPSPVVLANQRVGGSLTQALSVTNTAAADGFSEGLNASIGASGSATAGGSFSLLAAGATSNALFVGVDTATAGAKSGVATINFATDGTGTSGFAATALPGNQTVNVSGSVYRLAVAGPASPSPVVLANQRVGGSLTQALSVTNTAAADGFSEGLNATIGATGTATAGGSFSVLAAGATSNSLFVGVDTSTAGAKNGVATIAYASDGTGTSGFAASALPGNQTVNVSGSVFRLAVPQVDATPIVLAARVGDTAPSASVQVRNVGPDAFTERLDAGWAVPGPSGFTLAGSVVGLTAGASSTALNVSLATGTAGSFGGSAVVALASSGAGTTGAADAPLPSVPVGVTGRVYAPAVASVASVVDFGIVRRGEAAPSRGVTVSNNAVGALTDTLNAGISGAGGAFSANGSVTGLAAGLTNSAALAVSLDTAAAGVFESGAIVSLATANPDLGAATLPDAPVSLRAQVNNLAAFDLQRTAGAGTLSFDGAVAPGVVRYTLNLGSTVEGSGTLDTALVLLNPAAAPGDNLAGNWVTGDTGSFVLGGFGSFSLAASGAGAGLSVSLRDNAVGVFDRTVAFTATSTNGFGQDLVLSQVELRLVGNVTAVPEPGTYAMMLLGLLAMGLAARQRRVRTRA